MALALVLGAGAFVLGAISVRHDDAVDGTIDRETATQLAVQRALTAAVDAETGARGYTLTGDARFRMHYDDAITDFFAALMTARQLQSRRGDLIAQIDVVTRDFQDWIAEGGGLNVGLVAEGRVAEAGARIEAGEGERLFETFRGHMDALVATAQERVTAQLDSRADVHRESVALFFASILCALGLGGLVVVSVLSWRQARNRIQGLVSDLQHEHEISLRHGDILSAASHDLRNPLTGLVMASQLLVREARRRGDADYAELAAEILGAGRRSAGMVSELLDFARVDAGRLVLANEPLVPGQVVANAIADVHLSNPNAAVTIDDGLPPELRIVGDSARLRAVVRNLLENAFRYGAAPVQIRLLPANGEVEIHVEDAGQGIPTNEREMIFERFVRGSSAAGREGTGIGLYLCRGIVELHGGTLSVRDSRLGGADFTVGLPAAA